MKIFEWRASKGWSFGVVLYFFGIPIFYMDSADYQAMLPAAPTATGGREP